MKTIILFLLGLTASLAQPAGSSTPGAERGRGAGELAAIEQFLNLTDAELDQMTTAIARVRAMSPAEREALRREIAAFRKLPEEQRQQLRRGWGAMPSDIQNGWREMMHNATPEERAAIQARLQTLSPEEKTKYRHELVDSYLKARGGK